jgi:hypothetical protein
MDEQEGSSMERSGSVARRVRLVVMAAACLAGGAVHAADSQLARVAWLAGCWRGIDAEPGTAEHWMAPAGGTLLGMARTVRQGRTVEHEFLQIRETAEGKLVYVAQPSGQAMAQFTAIRVGEREVVFENAEHDFPQRILYRLDGEGRLQARIEGTLKGASKGLDFPMKRVSCDAPL